MAARHSTEDQSLGRMVLVEACKRGLQEIDQTLAGKTGFPYQLNANDYAEAHVLIGRLFSIIENAKLQQSQIGKAKSDAAFQQFLTGLGKRTCGRRTPRRASQLGSGVGSVE